MTKRVQSLKSPVPLFYSLTFKIFTISFNHILIPVKAILAIKLETSISQIILFDIYKSITLTHLISSGTNEVYRSPDCVSHKLYTPRSRIMLSFCNIFLLFAIHLISHSLDFFNRLRYCICYFFN